MEFKKAVMRLAVCAGLLALVAPLRAGEAVWTGSADRGHIIQLPAAWASGAAVPGLAPRGVPHAYSLMPGSRAYALDIAAEFTLVPKYVSTEEYFERARKLAGGPPALRAQLPDSSMFEYFSSSYAVKGRASYRVQGVLYKYTQRYYLTFSSARAYPSGRDWQEALRVLATLDPSEPEAGGWQEDFLRKLAGAGIGQNPPASSANLKYTAAARADGTPVSFEDIAIFGCKNFVGNLYLFNEEQTAHCWIAALKDYKAILARLAPRYWKDSHPFFQDCPAAMRQERACDPKTLRNFQPL